MSWFGNLFAKNVSQDDIQGLLNMEPKAPHLLKLLSLPPVSGLAMLRGADEPFDFFTEDGNIETFDPKDYCEADLVWAEEVLKIGMEGSDKARAGRFNEAIPSLKRALSMAPGHDLMLMTLGVCYAQIGEFPKAIKILEQARKLHPDNSRIAQNLEAIKRASR